jgi:hypothetical protein
MNSVHNRLYHPIIYSIERGPAVDLGGGTQRRSDRRPRSVTIVLAPEPEAARDPNIIEELSGSAEPIGFATPRRAQNTRLLP